MRVSCERVKCESTPQPTTMATAPSCFIPSFRITIDHNSSSFIIICRSASFTSASHVGTLRAAERQAKAAKLKVRTAFYVSATSSLLYCGCVRMRHSPSQHITSRNEIIASHPRFPACASPSQLPYHLHHDHHRHCYHCSCTRATRRPRSSA